jgi:hypothetical protein
VDLAGGRSTATVLKLSRRVGRLRHRCPGTAAPPRGKIVDAHVFPSSRRTTARPLPCGMADGFPARPRAPRSRPGAGSPCGRSPPAARQRSGRDRPRSRPDRRGRRISRCRSASASSSSSGAPHGSSRSRMWRFLSATRRATCFSNAVPRSASANSTLACTVSRLPQSSRLGGPPRRS